VTKRINTDIHIQYLFYQYFHLQFKFKTQRLKCTY